MQIHAFYKEAMKIFMDSLHGAVTRLWIIPVNDQPTVMAPLEWDGRLLLIKSK